MDLSRKILSDLTIFSKYARYLPEKNRRETWEEVVERNLAMHRSRFNGTSEGLEDIYSLVEDLRVVPSMRSAQFAGKPILLNHARIYNCAFMNVDSPAVFWEAMFLLLGGTGVGYSVQKRHVRGLPAVQGPKSRPRKYVIGDSIEGWADAVKVLVRAYFEGRSDPAFDFSDIRAKGELLVTSGGKAPGPQPLKDCLHNVRKVLDGAINRQLRPIEVHDILCYVADAVLAGGIRRAALISLFSIDDEEMLHAKHGNWWETNPQRGRANNSAVVFRNRVREEDFWSLWEIIEASGSGEPGIYFTNNPDWGTNPCVEIALRSTQMCNLTEIDASKISTQEELEEAAKAAAVLGTLQAAYTDFHYLRSDWQDTCEKDALLGVSITGIASGNLEGLDLRKAVDVIRTTNREWAEKLGIRPAARLTCIKPSGTTSLVCGTSAGIHAWHHPQYLRRMRVKKNEALYRYLSEHLPEYLEDDKFVPDQACVCIPIKAPEGAIYRNESALDLLERVKYFSTEWVKPGHNSGDNTHNISGTVSIKANEWRAVGEWLWENRSYYNGLSVLPYDGGSYVQAPFEDLSQERYEELAKGLDTIDPTQVKENHDETDLQGEIACGANGCLI